MYSVWVVLAILVVFGVDAKKHNRKSKSGKEIDVDHTQGDTHRGHHYHPDEEDHDEEDHYHNDQKEEDYKEEEYKQEEDYKEEEYKQEEDYKEEEYKEEEEEEQRKHKKHKGEEGERKYHKKHKKEGKGRREENVVFADMESRRHRKGHKEEYEVWIQDIEIPAGTVQEEVTSMPTPTPAAPDYSMFPFAQLGGSEEVASESNDTDTRVEVFSYANGKTDQDL
eukprot:TRINITY_DN564_c0_g1_i5.p1 TRINITY_DN564_c0_g1~~TRINITY_DN564_c0_g1_i5.p1  ORF type:complete len:223 (+),score=65.40 TRINITY_DN564_c0_g1_i5:27-695(+)